ncbi:glycoside hydrolase family 2 TIM barrel-domain containing protein [Sphingomonas solaris]|uniref:DUF4982 domain-containing protein n=1 Tax=Alterirhizorhabdus solaris TaxID=2529389 RepID=A0A558R448_9SPHN|nr:glycoside hydrolase family 2 TIM barrel-domain containing protein [Sphingomonas solaris]TVV74164.1 DUF4982 domain-containing protein [Sphingomonas solaris]
MIGVSRRTILKASVAGTALIASPFRAASSPQPFAPGTVSFDQDWRFLLGDAQGAQQPGFPDARWRAIDLPHDWSLEDRPAVPREATGWVPPVALANPYERPKGAPTLLPQVPIGIPIVPAARAGGPPLRIGPFDPEASGVGWATGWVVGGVGWYRKRFSLPDFTPGEQAEVIFDGAYMIAEAWLNGVPLGRNVNGYLPFTFDMTPHLRQDGANVLAVRVANEGATARWYSGSGLYRHVWLRRTGAARIPDHGVTVRTVAADRQRATLSLNVEIENRGTPPKSIECRIDIVDDDGRKVASTTETVSVAPAGNERITVEMIVDRPALWSPETPHLHYAEVTLLADGRLSDRQRPHFGIRTLRVSPEAGLLINGRSYKLRGACVHHDNGILGAVAIDRAERRKVEILKANGFNAIRCSHNPFSPAFLRACDELGMLVLNELFDTWEQGKFSPQGYQNHFSEHWRKDTTSWIRRDRNHPSVVFWSLGNEIPEVSAPRGIEIATQMRALILELDPTRLVTNALTPGGMGKDGRAARKLLDVAGYNYDYARTEEDHAADPTQIFVTTESFGSNAYDIWQIADRNPWFLGDFVWSGIDYIGETGSGSSRLVKVGAKPDPSKNFMGADVSNLFVWDYPAYQSGCGDIDLIGLKKPASYYRDVVWRRSPIALFVQRPLPSGMEEAISNWGWHDELASWTWPGQEGRLMTVRAYSRGDTVALLVDGKEIARKPVRAADKLKAVFTIPYAPGALTAIAYTDGKEVGRKTLHTVGAPARLRLRAEQASIGHGPDELAYLIAEVTDVRGQIVPDAAVPVKFIVAGAARLLRAGSANPYGIESFQNAETRTFHGVAQAILQPTGSPGECSVRAGSTGLLSDPIRIRIV